MNPASQGEFFCLSHEYVILEKRLKRWGCCRDYPAQAVVGARTPGAAPPFEIPADSSPVESEGPSL